MNSGTFNYIPEELMRHDKHKKADALKVNFNIKITQPEVKEPNQNLPLYKNKGVDSSMFSSPLAMSNKTMLIADTNIPPKTTKIPTMDQQHSKDEILFCAKSVLATIQTKKPTKRTIEMSGHDSLFQSSVTTNVKIDIDVPRIFEKGEVVKRTAWGRHYKIVRKNNPINNALKIPQFTAEEIDLLWISAKQKQLSQKEAEKIFNIKTIFEGSVITTRRNR
jgi:hypothetical protein